MSPLALDVRQEYPGVLLPLPPSGSSWSAPPDHQQCTEWRPRPVAEPAAPVGLQTLSPPAGGAPLLDMTSLFPGSLCNKSGPFSEWGPAPGPSLHFLHFLPDSQVCCCCPKRSEQDNCDKIVPSFFLGTLCPCPASPERRSQERRGLNSCLAGVQDRHRMMWLQMERLNKKSEVWTWTHWKATVPWTLAVSRPPLSDAPGLDPSVCYIWGGKIYLNTIIISILYLHRRQTIQVCYF